MATPKEKLIAEALKLVEKGQYERAVKIYLKVVEDDRSDVRIWLKIGDLYTKLRRNTEAADVYQQVASAYSDQGFYTKAIAVYKQILKLDPSLVKVHERLADLYKQMGLLPDAIEQYGQVAAHYQREGKMRDALGPLKQMVELEPQNVASRVKLAELYSREHMVREAIDEFARAAEYLHEQGRVDDYMKVAERLLFHAPDNRPVSRELARLYLQKGDARRALPRLQVCFKADPRDGETLGLLAEAFQSLGQTVKAISVLKELARIVAEMGTNAERVRVWRRVLELDPHDSEARAALNPSRPPLGAAAPVPAPTAQADPSGSVIVSESLTGLPSTSLSPSRASSPSLAPAPSLPAIPTPTVAEVDTSATQRSMPAFDLMLAQAAMQQRAATDPGAAALDEKEIAKILAETEVFAKYNLHAKAVEHVRSIFERSPDHVGARERLVSLFLNSGRRDEALAELKLLAEQAEGTPEQQRYLDEMLALMPADPWASDKRAAVRAGSVGPARISDLPMPPPEPLHIEVELDDEGLAEEDAAPEASLALDDPPAPVVSAPLAEPVAGQASEAEHELELAAVEDDIVDSDAFDGIEVVDETVDEVANAVVDAVVDETGHDDKGTDEFAVVVEDHQAAAAEALQPVTYDIEDRFGADLDGDPGSPVARGAAGAGAELVPPTSATPAASVASAHLPVHDHLAPELDPRTALASDEEEEVPVLFSGGSLEPDAALLPENVENFDFSAFEEAAAALSPTAALADAEEPVAGPPSPPPPPRRTTPPVAPPVPAARAAAGPVETTAGSPAFANQPEAEPEPEDDGPTGDVLLPPDEMGAPPSAAGLEDELEEADFYVAQGMLDEAREALGRLLASHPGHPLVLAKLNEVEAAAVGGGHEADHGIAVDMDDLLEVDEITSPGEATARTTASTTSSARRRESTGVTPQIVEVAVSDDDFESHFDLGIGCKEMGLYDQAISEFKLASRDPAREVQCQQMIGLCFVAKGQTQEAVRHFKQGLNASGIREDEELSLYYELGQAYQRLNDRNEALYYFERIRKRKPRYRDIERRIESLGSGTSDSATSSPAAALPRK